MSLSVILLEGRKDDFLSKFRNKFTNDELKSIFMLSRDLATNNKYLMFLGDVLESGNINLEAAKDIIQNFIKYQKVLPTKDIYLFKSLEDIKGEIYNHENKLRRQVKELSDADQVYEDENFVVVTPKTHKASCYYGAGTKWCTASMNGDTHFDKYNQDGKLFYIINKRAKSNDRFYKVALLNTYDGKQTFYDAPDKSFSDEWILNTPEWEKINKEIQSYLNDRFKREINIFKDKESARYELERIRNAQQQARRRRRLDRQREIKDNDEWSLNNNTDLSNKANAVFDSIEDEYGVTIEDGESVYNLVTADYAHMGLDPFEWLGSDYTDTVWAVATKDEAEEAAKNNLREMWDDMGVETFNPDFINSHIDNDIVKEYFEEMFEDMVYSSPEDYFDSSELPLSDEQETIVNKLEEELTKVNELAYYSDDELEKADAEERIDEIESDIEDIKMSPEGSPTDEAINNLVEGMLDDVMSDPVSYINDYGFNLVNFIDVEALIEDSIDIDGVGPAIAHYDGIESEVRINDNWYFVYRVD